MKNELYLFPQRAERGMAVYCIKFLLCTAFLAFCVQSGSATISVTLQTQNPTCGGFASGSVTAIPSGGVAPYTYLWNTGATTSSLNMIPAGFYAVTVTDATFSTASANATLTDPSAVTASITNINCSVPGSMTVVANGGTLPYTYSWTTGQTTPTISNLSAGQYCVTVLDANACGIIQCATTGSPPNVTVTTNSTGCGAGNNGSATANPFNGVPPYSYAWSNGGTSQTISNLASGNYTVTVTDDNNCTASATGNVSNSGGGFSIWLSANPPACGGNNGSITATVMGGIQPFTYLWSNGGTTQTISGLSAGTYSVTITDATGCTTSKTTTLTSSSNITVWASATNETCDGANDGTASVSGLGGIQPYTFNWSNGASGANIFNLSPGTYSVTATDALGCSAIGTVTVQAAPFFTVAVNGNNVSSCGAYNGSATAIPVGGTPPYSYAWSNGANAQTILGLGSGFYSVTITDANGCQSNGSIWISEPPNLNVSVTATPTICGNSNNGTATANVTGGTGPFTYQWSNGGSSQTIFGLTAGTYTVTVTDNAGCVGIASATISGNSNFIIDVISNNVTCYGGNNGSVTVSGWNGTAPYTYLWNNGSTSPTLTNLMAGTYIVTVTDAAGCSLTEFITITEPMPVVINVSSTGGCSGGNGTATANVTGGTAPYTYQWSNGANTQTVAGLSNGTYFVTVTDANFCNAIAAVNVTAGSSFIIDVISTNVTCYGGNNGSVTVSGWNGTPPYSYLWNNGSTSPTLTNLIAGTYIVTVTDAAGCSLTEFITITEPMPVVINVSSTGGGCTGGSGTATANVTGGTAPYTYQWSNGANTQTVNGLSSGTYFVTVTDANFCNAIAAVNVTAGNSFIIDVISNNVTCYGGNNGSVTVSGWNGTPPYSYLWNNGSTSPTLTNLVAGTYTVTVTDAAGCSLTEFITITEPMPIVINVSSTGGGCTGGSGTATANVTGGTAPYTYQWSNGANTQTVTGLSSGTYFVTVTDANFCNAIAAVNVTTGSGFILDVITTHVPCFGGMNGSITATGWNGTPPYFYQWSTGATTPTINNLPAGNYTVTVNDSGGCALVETITVTQPPVLILNITSSGGGCTGGNSSATANISGGTLPYSFSWNTGATTQTINNLSPGTYSVTVQDANYCVAINYVTITSGGGFIIDVASQNVLCNGGSTGSILVSGWNGTPPYAYVWNTGATTPDIFGLTSGVYTVTVTDAVGCVLVENITITEPPPININISSTNAGCSGGGGSATAFASGGTAPYTYQWSNGVNGQVINNLAPGTYSVTVLDANYCSETASVTIAGGTGLFVTILGTDLTCYGSNDGSAMSVVIGGSPPYSYNWSNGATSANISNLSAGSYSVTVTDWYGCSGTANVWISEPPHININVTTTNTNCGGGNTGSASAGASGGTPPFSYAWSNGQNGTTINNLAPGTYFVTVTDANNCTAIAQGVVNPGADLNINLITVNISCYGGHDGFAMAQTTGGTLPYSYIWNVGATTGGISGLNAGFYSVTVTDAGGCTGTASVWLTEPPPFLANVTTTNAACNSSNGTANANITTGGNPPFSYTWNNGATGANLNNLSPGTYTVTITDSNGCTAEASGTVGGGGNVSISVFGVDVSCYGSNDGSATAIVNNGTFPYSYVWSNGATSMSISNIGAGAYSVTVTDGNGCTDSGSVWISEPPAITVTVTKTDETCNGNNNGTATANAFGGSPPFSYTWSNGQSGAFIQNLSPGTYFVTATDFNGCIAISSTTINSGGNLNVSISSNAVTCYGGNDGNATAFANGGNQPYSYAWSNGGTSQTISNLTAGQYSVTVTDNSGCTGTASVWISEAPAMTLTFAITDPTCNGGNNGKITAFPAGGTSPYIYAWSNGQSTQTIQNLTAGTYSVTVTDANGCTITGSATLSNPTNITVTTSVTGTCIGAYTGSATATAFGGSQPYNFSWSNGSFGQTIQNIAAGNYQVTVTDANGCSSIASANVPANPTPNCSISITYPISMAGGNDGEASVSATGGTPGYTFQWSNGQSGNLATGLSAGTYTATVTDANGCTSMCGITLTDPSPCVNVTDPGSICCDQTLCGPGNDPDPIIEINPATGGVGNLEYLWMFTTQPGPFNANNWMIVPGATGLSYDPGPLYETTYFIRCVRRDNCITYMESNIITITVDNQAISVINGPDLVCVNEPEDYAAGASGTGATYSWNFGAGAIPSTSANQFVNGVIWTSFGTKTITLTVDNNGCTSTSTLDVTVSNSPIYCGQPLIINGTALSQDVVLLEWELEEFDNDESYSFIVERSADNLNFETIGEVDRIIDGGGMNHYEFFDQDPKKGRAFYRVMLEDSLSNFKYSNTVQIELLAGLTFVYPYPNPLKEQLNIEILEDYNGEISFELYTAHGVLLESKEVPQQEIFVQVDFSAYANGVYFLVAYLNGKMQKTFRIVKN